MTLVGAPSFRIVNDASMTWHAMSPIAPAPKSCHARQPNGWYVLWNGRIGAGPIHRSQSRPSGTACSSVGRGMPCGQIGRLVQQCTSRTCADGAGLEPLLHQAQALFGVALVAHLRDDLVLPRRLGQRPGLADGARQRLLHVDVLAQLHRGHRDQGVRVIRRGDEHRVDVLLLLEHHAVVLVLDRLRDASRASRASPGPPWRPRSRRSRTARRCCRSSPR